MTEKQAFAIISNVLRLEGVARRAAIDSNKQLRIAFRTIRELIAGLPEGSVERRLAYTQQREIIEAVLSQPTNVLSRDLPMSLIEEAPQQIVFASNYIGATAVQTNLLQAAALAAVDKARVLDKPLVDIFKVVTKTNVRRVNRVVEQGFLEGWTNDKIARELTGKVLGATGQNRAIARTAVMSMSQQTHNEFWNANNEVIEGWVFDASMDYKVCPICARLDGDKTKKRSKLPTPPLHPNCRCMVLPETGIETDTGDRSIVELYEKKPAETKGVRVYKQKVKGPDGKKYWKVAKDVDGDITMGGFINRANNITQESVLGKGRAKRFRALVKGTPGSQAPLSPEDALIRVTK